MPIVETLFYFTCAILCAAIGGIAIHTAIVAAYVRGAEAAIAHISKANFNIDILARDGKMMFEIRTIEKPKPPAKEKSHAK